MNFKLIQQSSTPGTASCWLMEHIFGGTDNVFVNDSVEFYRINDVLIHELKTQPNVIRTSYNIWTWQSKEDAEKFLTYFTLKYMT